MTAFFHSYKYNASFANYSLASLYAVKDIFLGVYRMEDDS